MSTTTVARNPQRTKNPSELPPEARLTKEQLRKERMQLDRKRTVTKTDLNQLLKRIEAIEQHLRITVPVKDENVSEI